jgi:hypothetical protein
MKKYALMVLAVILCLSIAIVADAQRRYGQSGGEQYNYCPYCGSELAPEGGYGHGYGVGPGMMHRGYGPGPGMMYRGRGMGPGMMVPGYGMGQEMMRPGYGGGPGMMGRGWGYGYGQSEECQKFLEQTSDLRKQIHTKRFEYSEALRNTKTKPETLGKLEKEIYDLSEKIYKQAPPECR